jgi:outer membrane murein-binding lipoprotein Lpp
LGWYAPHLGAVDAEMDLETTMLLVAVVVGGVCILCVLSHCQDECSSRAEANERKSRVEALRREREHRENERRAARRQEWKKMKTRMSARRIVVRSMVADNTSIKRLSTREKAEEGQSFRVLRHGSALGHNQAAALRKLDSLFRAGEIDANAFNAHKSDIMAGRTPTILAKVAMLRATTKRAWGASGDADIPVATVEKDEGGATEDPCIPLGNVVDEGPRQADAVDEVKYDDGRTLEEGVYI